MQSPTLLSICSDTKASCVDLGQGLVNGVIVGVFVTFTYGCQRYMQDTGTNNIAVSKEQTMGLGSRIWV